MFFGALSRLATREKKGPVNSTCSLGSYESYLTKGNGKGKKGEEVTIVNVRRAKLETTKY